MTTNEEPVRRRPPPPELTARQKRSRGRPIKEAFRRARKRKAAARPRKKKFHTTKPRPLTMSHAKPTKIARRMAEKIVTPNPEKQISNPPDRDDLDMVPGRFDGRTYRPRRFREHLREFITDQGGQEMCSHNQILISRRAAAVAVMCEHQEELWLFDKKQFNLEDYIKLAQLQVTYARILGMKRIPRVVGPAAKATNLRQYLELTDAEKSVA